MERLAWRLAGLLLSCAVGDVGALPAKQGAKVGSSDEVVNFFAIGDWGPTPAAFFRSGSMHADCSAHRGEERCQKNSPAWLREENAQKNVMERMLSRAQKQPIKWVVNAGGNFHFSGIQETGILRWKVDETPWTARYDDVYSDSVFQVPWFSVLGTSDWGGECCAKDLFGGPGVPTMTKGHTHVMEQIKYDTEKDWEWPDEKARRWVLPYFYWSKVVDLGPYKTLVVGIDTNFAGADEQCTGCGSCVDQGNHEEVDKRGCLDDTAGGQCHCFFRALFSEQLDWLEFELARHFDDESIIWRFVVAHHPWNFIPTVDGLMHRFLNILSEFKVQVVFSGHDHSMRHDVLDGNVNMVMTGSSGGHQFARRVAPRGNPFGSTVWSSNETEYGFAHIQMTSNDLKVSYINDLGIVRKTVVIEAKSKHVYVPLPWTNCSNLCGQGTHSRSLKCMALRSDGAVGEERPMSECEDAEVVKLATSEKCFPDGAPAFEFCDMCDDVCHNCTEGFDADTQGTCKNDGVAATLEMTVVVPLGDGWRGEVRSLLLDLLEKVMDMSYPVFDVHVTSLVPKTAAVDSRRLVDVAGVYLGQAVVTVIQNEALAAAQLRSRLAQLNTSDLLPLRVDDIEISAAQLHKVLCPGLEELGDAEHCSGRDDPGGSDGDSDDGHGGGSDGDSDDGHGGGTKPTGGGSGGWWIWVALGLLVGAVGLFLFMRRRRTAVALPVNAMETLGTQDVQLQDVRA